MPGKTKKLNVQHCFGFCELLHLKPVLDQTQMGGEKKRQLALLFLAEMIAIQFSPTECISAWFLEGYLRTGGIRKSTSL